MEQLDYNLLFRWFVGLAPDAPVWVPTTFTKNRERLQEGDVFQQFMTALLNHAQVKPLLSDEHFSVDGTLIEAWASFKSFKPKDESDDSDGSNFHKQKRGNDTHASTTDPDCRLYRKAEGREAKLLSTAETKCAKWRRESVPVGLREKGREALICWCAADLGFGVGVSFGR